MCMYVCVVMVMHSFVCMYVCIPGGGGTQVWFG